MNTHIPKIYLLAGLLACTACSNEEELPATTGNGSDVAFGATIQDNLLTRALGDNKADEVALPYIYEINVRMEGSNADKIYHVRSGNKGTLEVGTGSTPGNDPFKWGQKKAEEVDFFAWTEPGGVTIDNATSLATEGTVDFTNASDTGGNYYLASDHENENNNVTTKNSINGVSYTPLEVFISAYGTGNFNTSPSVMLPFKHLVSKLSIVVRDWDFKDITTDEAAKISITFLSIKDKWKVAQTETGTEKKPFHITEPTSDEALTLSFTNLKTETGTTNVVCYLPPMDNTVGIDMANAGDFYITYDSNKYFGTLKDCLGTGKNSLAAGEHMRIVFDLTKNYGAGVGAWIDNWKVAKEEVTYTDPRQGIYSLEGWKILVDHLNKGDMASLPDSLYTTDDVSKVKTISLYNNLSITSDLLPTGKFSGFTFDGLGHTVTLPTTATQGLFGVVGDDQQPTPATTIIRNLHIAGGTITGASGSLGALAGTATNTTIGNCHLIAGTVANSGTDATDIAGGLVGTAGTGTTLTNCSVETTGAISVGTDGTVGALVGSLVSDATISNSFAVFTGAAAVSLVGGTSPSGITYSYCWNTSSENKAGNFWGDTGETGTITFDAVSAFKTSVTIGSETKLLLDALNAGKGTGNGWVYVYGKGYPVFKIE